MKVDFFHFLHWFVKYAKWLIIPAMIGGATLLSDGALTPAVTVTSAIEGLRTIPAFELHICPRQNSNYFNNF